MGVHGAALAWMALLNPNTTSVLELVGESWRPGHSKAPPEHYSVLASITNVKFRRLAQQDAKQCIGKSPAYVLPFCIDSLSIHLQRNDQSIARAKRLCERLLSLRCFYLLLQLLLLLLVLPLLLLLLLLQQL